MLISLNRIHDLLGEELWQAALNIHRRSGVRDVGSVQDQATYLVVTDPPHRVVLNATGEHSCTCEYFRQQGVCLHLAAAAMMAKQDGSLARLEQTCARAAGPRLLGAMESAIPQESTVRMEVLLIREDVPGQRIPVLRMGLRLGEKRLYVVRSLPALIQSIDKGEPLSFGKGFSFNPEWMRFSPADERVIHLLRTLFSAAPQQTEEARGRDLRLVSLPVPYVEALLGMLEEVAFRFGSEEDLQEMQPVRQTLLPLRFMVGGGLRGLTIDGYLPRDCQPLTASCSYVLAGGQIYRVPQEQRGVLQVLWQETRNGHAGFAYSVQDAPRVVGSLLPVLRLCGVVELEDRVDAMLEKLPLKAQVYLDRVQRHVAARVRFCYGSRSIDPFDEAPPPKALAPGEKLLLRDAASERQVLDALGRAGFTVTKGQVYLTGSDQIYHFFMEGMHNLQEYCELFASKEFETLKPRGPRLQGTLRMDGGRLQLDLLQDQEPTPEILAIMEALARRKDYFRLKDGSFLDLTQLTEWQGVAELVTETAAAEGAERVDLGTELSLNTSRLPALAALLQSQELQVTQDEAVQETMRLLEGEGDPVPLPQGVCLRPYQERGFQWLCTLDRLHLGGILADDMGLGKTIQMISLFKHVHGEARMRGEHPVSLVVSPTSLTYNWLNELNRFAPELSVMVLSGSGPQRAAQLEHVKRAGDVDVLVTSYPLIRRDIDQMKDFTFRFAVLDEAQQIKNAGSVGALSVKQLQAESRFALTGTPMQNSTGELWSIFDFVLPGYLGTYSSFVRRYQDGSELDDLRRRIRPFLMRRLKQDVLTELPDKLETVITAQMTPEQEKVYQAALVRLRSHVDMVMSQKGLSRGRAEVISAMTELRQICCHPGLVLSQYTGSSGKLDLLLDILPGSLKSGRRVLLFSQFTGMLKRLRRQLQENGIACLYLDGETPGDARLEMVERFNGGWGQVFLISLKAGGMGLNLTGADMVIHYDPWWNPAAEEQATDRAYRIGQTRKVDVIRLVTHGSIEEQVVALGERKRALFDQLITPGEQLITALTEADIRALFS